MGYFFIEKVIICHFCTARQVNGCYASGYCRPQYPSSLSWRNQPARQGDPVNRLRVRLGLTSFLEEVEEFCAMLEQREQDHRNWLVELEASVHESRQFKLATDPHQCAFGKWYDNYKPQSYTLDWLLKCFDEPHRQIHAIAAKAKSLETMEDINRAHQIIEECRDKELREMIDLFAEVRRAYRQDNREIAIVYSSNSQVRAFSADTVNTVEMIAADDCEEIPENFLAARKSGVILSTGRRTKSKELVLLLDHNRLAEIR